LEKASPQLYSNEPLNWLTGGSPGRPNFRPPSVVVSIRLNGSQIVLTWDAAAGQNYIVERTSDLRAWTGIGPASGEFRQTIATSGAEFFRVRAQ
jgi:hypothetical protein